MRKFILKLFRVKAQTMAEFLGLKKNHPYTMAKLLKNEMARSVFFTSKGE